MDITVENVMDTYVVDGDNGRYLDIKELIGDVALEREDMDLMKLSIVAGKISKMLFRENEDTGGTKTVSM